jgi:hypothetical protein
MHYLKNNPSRNNRYFQKERTTINTIRRDYPSVKFVAADKNIGLVALNQSDYHSMCLTHLSDENTYTVLETPSKDFFTGPDYYYLTKYIKNLIARVNRLRDLTTQEQKLMQLEGPFKLPKFKILPKLHKQYDPAENPPSRPIVSSCQWITTHWSAMLDIWLQPYLADIPTIIGNNRPIIDHFDLLISTNTRPPSNSYLVSFDIVSLYTNIDITLLLQVINNLDPVLAQITSFVIKNNYFAYNDIVYRQLQGIAMGTPAAVSLANLYLGKLLDNYFVECIHFTFFRRYIDDCLGIWIGSSSQLEEFKLQIDNVIPGITTTIEKTQKSLAFLDLQLNMSVFGYSYCLYRKSLNRYAYITQRSQHPPHTIKGFITSEINRIRQNSSNPRLFQHSLDFFFTKLRLRGYTRIYLAKFDIRFIIPTQIIPKPIKILPFRLKYSTRVNSQTISKLFYNHKHDFANFLPQSQLRLVYQRNNNLLELIQRPAIHLEPKNQFIYDVSSSSDNSSQNQQTPPRPQHRLSKLLLLESNAGVLDDFDVCPKHTSSSTHNSIHFPTPKFAGETQKNAFISIITNLDNRDDVVVVQKSPILPSFGIFDNTTPHSTNLQHDSSPDSIYWLSKGEVRRTSGSWLNIDLNTNLTSTPTKNVSTLKPNYTPALRWNPNPSNLQSVPSSTQNSPVQTNFCDFANNKTAPHLPESPPDNKIRFKLSNGSYYYPKRIKSFNFYKRKLDLEPTSEHSSTKTQPIRKKQRVTSYQSRIPDSWFKSAPITCDLDRVPEPENEPLAREKQ